MQIHAHARSLRTGLCLSLHNFAALPFWPCEDDGGDLFLDLEGMALFKDPYFLNYLIGISLRDGSYLEWWSHRLEDEAQSFQKVLDYVFNRRKEYPDMHVYCYGHYEAGAFRRTARRLSDEYQAMTEELNGRSK